VADADAASDLLAALPARDGHFLLESGFHTDSWLTLDALFVDPAAIAPQVAALAAKLRPYAPTAICGSLLGGAFLAQALATELRARFYFTAPSSTPRTPGMYTADYSLLPELARRIHGERVAVVDDVISAGSSARATVRAVAAAGAQTVVVAALMILGNAGVGHFASAGLPLEALDRRTFNVWSPDECPLCRAGHALGDPLR
jgi:orotate phosphoribosyltransferase